MNAVWTLLQERVAEKKDTLLVVSCKTGEVGLYTTEQEFLLGVSLELPKREYKKPEMVSLLDEDWYVERVSTKPSLVICGAGHIAVPLVACAALLNLTTYVLDDRAAFANRDRFPKAKEVLVGPFPFVLEQVGLTSSHYVVIITRGHRFDEACVRVALQSSAPYVGMIGSRSKVTSVVAKLKQEGFSEALPRLFSPIGLPIFAETPEEIAIAILGQIISEKNKKGGTEDMETLLSSMEKTTKNRVLAIILKAEGSSPRGVGAKMLLGEGFFAGTIGGGALEKKVQDTALKAIREGKVLILDFDLTGQAEEEGMICGGAVKVGLFPLGE